MRTCSISHAFAKQLTHNKNSCPRFSCSNFSAIVGDADMDKLRDLLKRAGGELQQAVNLYYDPFP